MAFNQAWGAHLKATASRVLLVTNAIGTPSS
jgi:hypothetical protein